MPFPFVNNAFFRAFFQLSPPFLGRFAMGKLSYVSSKYIRLGMGVLFILFVGVLISTIFPLYEEKQTDELAK